MGIFDKNKQVTTVTELTETYNVGIQGAEGPAVASVGGVVNLELSDAGAIDAGRDLGLEALYAGQRGLDTLAELGSDTVWAAQDIAARGLDSAYDLSRLSTDAVLEGGRRAFDFASDAQRDAAASQRDALSFVEDSNARAFDFADDAGSRAFDFAGDAGSRAFDFAAETFDATLGAIERAGSGFVGAVERFQARESSNTDARLQDITRQVLWVGGAIAGVALLGAFIVPALRRAA